MQWVLFGELFSALARATNREGVQPAIPKWLDMIAAFIEQGSVAASELNFLKMQIQTMVRENREPTDDEWSELKERSDAAHDIIQNADLGEPEPEPEPDPEPEPEPDPDPVDDDPHDIGDIHR